MSKPPCNVQTHTYTAVTASHFQYIFFSNLQDEINRRFCATTAFFFMSTLCQVIYLYYPLKPENSHLFFMLFILENVLNCSSLTSLNKREQFGICNNQTDWLRGWDSNSFSTSSNQGISEKSASPCTERSHTSSGMQIF